MAHPAVNGHRGPGTGPDRAGRSHFQPFAHPSYDEWAHSPPLPIGWRTGVRALRMVQNVVTNAPIGCDEIGGGRALLRCSEGSTLEVAGPSTRVPPECRLGLSCPCAGAPDSTFSERGSDNRTDVKNPPRLASDSAHCVGRSCRDLRPARVTTHCESSSTQGGTNFEGKSNQRQPLRGWGLSV